MSVIEKMAEKSMNDLLGGDAWALSDDERRHTAVKAMMRAFMIAEIAPLDSNIIAPVIETLKKSGINLSENTCKLIFRIICGSLRKEAAISLATTTNSSGRWTLPGKS